MVGCFLSVFSSLNMFNKVSNVNFDSVKCGFAKKLGNKGAVIIRFNIEKIKIAFIGCHLPSGNKKNTERLNSLALIHEKAFNKESTCKEKK